MRFKSLLFFLLFFSSCSSYQTTTITYKPLKKKIGYVMEVPANFIQGCIFAENDYCYEYIYNNKDFDSAIIYIHYYPMSCIIDEVAENVRFFYGDSLFCKLCYAYLDEEDMSAHQPLYNQHIIDSVSRSIANSDTLTLVGKDGSTAWKEIRIKNTIVIGYFNVPIRKCKLFDKALFTLQPIDSIDFVDEYRKGLR